MAVEASGSGRTPLAFPGLSINGFTNSPQFRNCLRYAETFRSSEGLAELSANAIAAESKQTIQRHRGGVHRDFPSATRSRIGHCSRVQAVHRRSFRAWAWNLFIRKRLPPCKKGNQTPGLIGVFLPVSTSMCHKSILMWTAKKRDLRNSLGRRVLTPCKVYLGSPLRPTTSTRSAERTRLNVQAESSYRLHPEDISHLPDKKPGRRNDPSWIGSGRVKPIYGPDRCKCIPSQRIPAADLMARAAPGFSTSSDDRMKLNNGRTSPIRKSSPATRCLHFSTLCFFSCTSCLPLSMKVGHCRS